METQKTKAVLQKVTRTVTQKAKQVKTRLQLAFSLKQKTTNPLNPERTTLLINLDKVKAEKDQWEENYHRLRTALLEKEKIEKLIKSIL